MTPFGHIRFAAKSDVGRKRKNNEDAFGVFPSCGVFCVADGMGGGDDGEIASAATVEGVRRFCEAHPFPSGKSWRMDDWLEGISNGVSEASAWIHGRARERGLKGCGSTFVGVCFDPSHPAMAVALHAGDSRLYLLRRRGIRQITKDHSAAEMIGVKNERDMNPLFRGMILRAVGILPSIELERTMFAVKPGDRILICSDGLSKMLPDKRIAALGRTDGSLSDAVEALIAAANEAGGVDNVTVVLVEVGDLPRALPVVPILDSPARSTDTGEGRDTDSTGESDTRDTGETLSMTMATEAVAPEDFFQEGATHEAVLDKCEIQKPKRHLMSSRGWIVLGIASALLALGGVFGWLVWRRNEVSKAAEDARRAEMSVTAEAVSRQASEKGIQRAREDAALRVEDEKERQKQQEEERRNFQGNVDLPVE